MEPAEICVTFIAGILGVAYPLLLEVISRLDDKYASTLVVNLFDKETWKRGFTILLIASLAGILLWVLQLPRHMDFSSLNFFVDRSALILLGLTTILLIVVFFLLVHKIITYYNLEKFTRYLISKHNSDLKKDKNDYRIFRTISDVLFFSIRSQNITIAKTISDFMYPAFKKFRDYPGKNGVEYPVAFYEMIYKAIEELARQQNRGLVFLEDRTAGSLWLLGELQDAKVSEATYSWMWRNQVLSLTYGKEEYVMYHWQHAHQHYVYQLRPIDPKYSKDYSTVLNEAEIEARSQERRRFLEFHYMLGALVLYQGKYELIKRMFDYTTSIPPRYELLPISMDEIFHLYFEYLDPYSLIHTHLSFKYYFPKVDGLHADDNIKEWLGMYLALLFIRQYSIVPYLITITPLALPNIPKTQGEKRKWINNIDRFKKHLEIVLGKKDLLKATGLDFVTDEWCKDNSHLTPIGFIESLKSKLEGSFEETEINEPIDPEKVSKFTTYTNERLNETFEQYEPLNNKQIVSEDYNRSFINGLSQVMEKKAFAKDQGVDHLNFHSFVADSMAEKYCGIVSQTFVANSAARYLLAPDDVIPALVKLKADKDYVLVAFNVDLPSLTSKSTISLPNEIEVLSFYAARSIDAIFIVKRTDLPSIIYADTKKEYIEESELQLINDTYKIYASVVDVNRNNKIYQELQAQAADDDFRKSVVVNIYVNIEIRWRKNSNCVQINVQSPFRQKGLPNSLSDVAPIA